MLTFPTISKFQFFSKPLNKECHSHRFMWTLYSKDPDHWVPISTVASFKRMREFSTSGIEWLANAIRLSEFLQVDETGTKVRRTTEPKESNNQLQRSVYAVRFVIIILFSFFLSLLCCRFGFFMSILKVSFLLIERVWRGGCYVTKSTRRIFQ